MLSACVYACIPRFLGPRKQQIIRKSFFFRSSDQTQVQRYFCNSCGRTFSTATRDPEFRQKKRYLNRVIARDYASTAGQRRLAYNLTVTKNTVVRKIRFMAERSRIEARDWKETVAEKPRTLVLFDDLETSEHTKCKPLSVAVAIDGHTREILGFQVSRMPARGRLAKIARRKYPYRPDERGRGWDRLMVNLKPLVASSARFVSDQNPHYRAKVKRHHPGVTHVCIKGQKSRRGGQGELKKGGFDPIFRMNHTLAQLRADLNRLIRRTWCTTKNVRGIEDHLALYVSFHNRRVVGKPVA